MTPAPKSGTTHGELLAIVSQAQQLRTGRATMTPARKPPAGGELVAIVSNAPRPKLADRGQLMFADDIVALFGGHKSRWFVNHSFMPEKKLKIGRDNAWWEVDVLDAIDRGTLGR